MSWVMLLCYDRRCRHLQRLWSDSVDENTKPNTKRKPQRVYNITMGEVTGQAGQGASVVVRH
jgi:hypothetical protein